MAQFEITSGRFEPGAAQCRIWTYFICPKTTKSRMIAPRASVQLGISMPAIDVFWLNHPMAILPREAASVGGLLSYSTDSPMVGLSGLRAVGGEPVHDLGIGGYGHRSTAARDSDQRGCIWGSERSAHRACR